MLLFNMKDLSFINALPAAQRQAILDGPAMVPPPGVIPNFDHPPNKDGWGYGIASTAAVLCTLFVILRVYSRVFYHKKLAIEDGRSKGTSSATAIASLLVVGLVIIALVSPSRRLRLTSD